MPATWLPGNWINRRLLNAAFATALAFTSLTVIPGVVAPAYGATTDECGADGQDDSAECLPELSIEKSTNGQDADAAPGPAIPAGDAVIWTYDATNTGPVTVYDIVVTDDDNDGAAISCTGQENGSITLNPGEAIQCTASSVSWYTVNHTQHQNLATVSGHDFNENPVVAGDMSH